jgi:hypothetical protein
MPQVQEMDVLEDDDEPARRRRRKPAAGAAAKRGGEVVEVSLLRQETVPMTVLAQDPEVRVDGRPLVAAIPVPSSRLERGPRNHRFHVVDVSSTGTQAEPPVLLHLPGKPWTYVDEFADPRGRDDEELVKDRAFRAQNVFAIAAHTLALFERYLGRRIPWRSGWPQLYLVPSGSLSANAAYSPNLHGVVFGWLPKVAGLPEIHTCLSYDVVAHEVSHAILDGLRPRYVEPGLPDQLAFHEALADLVAMLSVFGLPGTAFQLLRTDRRGRLRIPGDGQALGAESPQARIQRRTDFLKTNPLLGLAEQLGRARALLARSHGGLAAPATALRRSVEIPPGTAWQQDPDFAEPHRRAEILVAAFMQSLAGMWAARLEVFDDRDGLDAARVAEEGETAAEHLLGMLLRSLDYLPPVELEFSDVIDAALTADRRLNPDDRFDYRTALEQAFRGYGIEPPPHQILDRDGMAAPSKEEDGKKEESRKLRHPYRNDPDAGEPRIRYQHLNFAALRSSPEEVFAFMWNNAAALGLDLRLATRVDQVHESTRVGPDGLIVTEVLADYTQWIGTTAGRLPKGMTRPAEMDEAARVELWGGGVLVFDQFGRFRLHQRKLVLDIDRQQRRLDDLFRRGLSDARGGFGTTDGVNADERFALLHSDDSEDCW